MFNLPNILAIVRIILAPLLFFILLQMQNPQIHITWLNYFATLTFILACVTDFFDGFIARKWAQVTKLGEILDPLADKMLTLGAFLGLMLIGRANPWAVYLILIREFFITGFRVILASSGAKISASIAGKIKTVFQMIAIGFLCMSWFGGEILLWVAVILTMYSGFEYVLGYYKFIKNKNSNLE